MAKTWFKKHVFSGSGWLHIPTQVIWIILAIVCIPVSNVHIYIEAEENGWCPLACECYNVTSKNVLDAPVKLQCGEENLTKLSSDMFTHNTIFLNVSHNLLSALEFGETEATLPLRILILSYNKLQFIGANAFQSFSNLQTLDLSWNMITNLSASSFIELTSLKSLFLNHNKLGQLTHDLFAPLLSLEVLDFSFNEVTSIENETFRSLKSLQELNLAHNSLRKLNKSWFEHLYQLKVLNVSKTNLIEVKFGDFSALRALQYLDLSKNNITRMNKEIFQHMLHLKTVNVSNNPFECNCDINSLALWLNRTRGAETMFSKELICFDQDNHKWISILKVSVGIFQCKADNVSVFGVEHVLATLDTLPYNAMMGWYTAATLSGMLVLFFICIALDKLKREFFKKRRKWRKKKKYSQTSAGEMELQHHKPKLKRCVQTNENSSLSGSFNRKPNEECASSCHVQCEHTHSLVVKNDHELETPLNGAGFAFKKLNMDSCDKEIKDNFRRNSSHMKKIKRPHSDPYILYQTIEQIEEINA